MGSGVPGARPLVSRREAKSMCICAVPGASCRVHTNCSGAATTSIRKSLAWLGVGVGSGLGFGVGLGFRLGLGLVLGSGLGLGLGLGLGRAG